MSNDLVVTEKHGPRLEIVLNRPEKRNAIDIDVVEALSAAIARSYEDDVRIVLLRAQGKAFSVGGDVKFFRQTLVSGDIEVNVAERNPDKLHRCIESIVESPRVFVAAVHGACAGAGLGLALACDLVVAADSARFATAFVGIGASPDSGTTWLLPRTVGHRKAMELFINPFPFDAAEAHRLGIVNRLSSADSLLAEARKIADQFAAGPSAAYGRLKRLMHTSHTNTLHDQLAHESRMIVESFETNDFAEGVSAFVEKRFPVFEGN